MNWLLVVPTQAELTGIGISEHDVVVCGAGLVAAAANVSVALRDHKPDAVLLLGICGSYNIAEYPLGALLRVDSSILADFGVEEVDGSFRSATAIGFGDGVYKGSPMSLLPKADPWARRLQSLPFGVSASVQCVTGTEATAMQRRESALIQVEEMEGAAVFAVCNGWGIPVYQVRAVSNRAGLRDRTTWRIDLALEALYKWSHHET